MTAHITKTWLEDGKLITQGFEEKDTYKREFVGLTDDEVDDIANSILTDDPVLWWRKLSQAIEAKLKERNT